MKKLIIAVLLIASTQAQARYFTQNQCFTAYQATAYAYSTVKNCGVNDAYYRELADGIDNSNCNRFGGKKIHAWMIEAFDHINDIIKERGNDNACKILEEAYNATKIQ